MTQAVHPFPHMTCTNLLKIYAWKTFVCNDVFSARHGNFTFFNSSYALTTCIYTCHHNKLFLERKNNANIKIKENNSLPFLCIFRRQPHWTQSESVMGKKVLYIHLYLERQDYQKFLKYPDFIRLDKQTILSPLLEMLSSQTKKNLSRKKNRLDLRQENWKTASL